MSFVSARGRLGWVFAITRPASYFLPPVYATPKKRKPWVMDKDWLQREPKRSRRRKGQRR